MVAPPSPLLLLSIAALCGATWQVARVADAPAYLGPHRDKRPLPAGLLVPLLPSAWIAGPGSILAMAAGMMLVSSVLRRQSLAMLGWFTVALACDRDAAAVAPFVIAIVIRRQLGWRPWAGVAAATAAGLYLKPFGVPPATLDIPNLWPILAPYINTPLTGLALAALAGALAWYIAALTAAPLDTRGTIETAALAPLLVASLSPIGMGTLIAGSATLAIACRWPDRRSVTIAALVQSATLLALADTMALLAAIPLLAAAALLARPLLGRPANDNALSLQTT